MKKLQSYRLSVEDLNNFHHISIAHVRAFKRLILGFLLNISPATTVFWLWVTVCSASKLLKCKSLGGNRLQVEVGMSTMGDSECASKLCPQFAKGG